MYRRPAAFVSFVSREWRSETAAIPTIHFVRRRDIGAIRVILKRELIKGRRMQGVWWTRQCPPVRLSRQNGRNSDAQDLSVCCCRRINLGRRRRMAGLSHLRACPRSRGSRGRSVTTHDESKGSACGGVCRPYLRLSLNGSRPTNTRSCRPRPQPGQRPVRPLPARAALHARARP